MQQYVSVINHIVGIANKERCCDPCGVQSVVFVETAVPSLDVDFNAYVFHSVKVTYSTDKNKSVNRTALQATQQEDSEVWAEIRLA